jgi:hypothetical protein
MLGRLSCKSIAPLGAFYPDSNRAAPPGRRLPGSTLGHRRDGLATDNFAQPE